MPCFSARLQGSRLSLLSCPHTGQLYPTEILYPPAVLRDTVEEMLLVVKEYR